MKYCEKCNVGVHKDLVTCPLCGKHVEEVRENFFERYEREIEPKAECAKLMPVKTRGKFLSRLFLTVLLLIIAVAVTANLLYDSGGAFAHYITFGALLAYVDIFLPIAKGKRLHNSIIINVIVLSVFIMLIDLLLPGGWTGFTFTRGFPIIALSCLAAIDFMIIIRRKTVKEYFVNLYFVSLYALAPAIVLWSLSSDQSVLAAVTFFISVTNVAILSVILYPWIAEEFRRKFFLD